MHIPLLSVVHCSQDLINIQNYSKQILGNESALNIKLSIILWLSDALSVFTVLSLRLPRSPSTFTLIQLFSVYKISLEPPTQLHRRRRCRHCRPQFLPYYCCLYCYLCVRLFICLLAWHFPCGHDKLTDNPFGVEWGWWINRSIATFTSHTLWFYPHIKTKITSLEKSFYRFSIDSSVNRTMISISTHFHCKQAIHTCVSM